MKLIIQSIVNFLMTFITSLMGPLSSTILSLIPDLSGYSTLVSGFFDWIVDFVTWALSWLPFTTSFYVFFSVYWVFRLSVPLLTHTLKTIIKWWHMLAP